MQSYLFNQLPNGLRVVTIPMPNRNSAAVAVWVGVGSRYEPANINGISHFLEHMVFKGTRRRTTRQIKEEIEGVGGSLNAFTSEESTCYFAKLLHRDHGKALDVLSDMVLNARLAEEEFRKEKPVVLEEIKMYRDQPAQHVQDLIGQLLWEQHPLGRPIAGTQKTVSAMKRAQMKRFMENHYQPGNMLVVVAGPVDHGQVLRETRKLFPSSRKLKRGKFVKGHATQGAPRTLLLEKDTEQVHFVIGFHSLSRYDRKRHVLNLLHVLLGANMSSRLFEEVREKRGLAYDIRSQLSFFEDTGSFQICAGVETGKTVQAIRVILRELQRISQRPVGSREMARARDYYLNQLDMTLEDTLDHVLWAGERLLYSGQVPDTDNIRKSIEQVTAQDIQQLAQKLFRNQNLNLTLIGPINGRMQGQIQNRFRFH